jgi:hypothetical protein
MKGETVVTFNHYGSSVMSKAKNSKPLVLAMEIAFRTALLGIPSVQDLRTEYGISRATAYRYRSHVTQVLYRRSSAVKAAA